MIPVTLLAFLVGYPWVRALDRASAWPLVQRAAMGWASGWVALSTLAFCAAWSGIDPRWALAPAAILAVAGWSFARRAKEAPAAAAPWFPGAWTALLPVTVALCALAFSWAVPSYFDDEKSNWNLKAKWIAAEGVVTADPASPAYLGGGGHREYPLFMASFKALGARLTGGWPDRGENLPDWALSVSLALAVAWSLGAARWWFLAAASSLPLVFWHLGSGYHDLPVALGAALFLTALSFWVREGRDWGWAAGLGLAVALAAKNEGFVLVLPAACAAAFLAFFARKPSWRDLLAMAFLPFLVSAANLPFRALYGLSLNPHSSLAAYGWHPDAPALFWQAFAVGGSHGPFWFLAPVALLLVWPAIRRPESRPAAAGCAVLLCALFAVFAFTNNYQFLLDQTTVNRTALLFQIPFLATVLFAALQLPSHGRR